MSIRNARLGFARIIEHPGKAKSMPRAMADDDVHRNLQFGPFELSSRERVLRRDGVVLPLGSRALDILIYLAERPGEVIAKQELIDHVWSDVTVEEGSLRVHVAAIRKALGDGQFGNRYIANIKGRGYSFVGTVVPFAGNTESRNDKFRYQGRLPVRPIMMIGRETLVSEVSDKLRNERFVTLLGLGGIGKTTIALAVGRAVAEEFGGKSILLTWKALPIRGMLWGPSRHPWDLHSNRMIPAWSWSTSFVPESFFSFSIAVST